MVQPFLLVTPLGWQYLSVKASESPWLDPACSSKMVRIFHLQALGCKWGPLTCHRQFEGPHSDQPFGGWERHRLLRRGLELYYHCMENCSFFSPRPFSVRVILSLVEGSAFCLLKARQTNALVDMFLRWKYGENAAGCLLPLPLLFPLPGQLCDAPDDGL